MAAIDTSLKWWHNFLLYSHWKYKCEKISEVVTISAKCSFFGWWLSDGLFYWLHSLMDLCRHLVMVCFRHRSNFKQWDFWNVVKKVLFVTKFPVVNLYSRTLLTQVGLLQFPLDLTKKIQSWLVESPLTTNYCLQGRKTALLCSS